MTTITAGRTCYQMDALRRMLGRKVAFQEHVYRIIEILEDGPSMVLQMLGVETVIQPDQHGEAHRRVPETWVVPIFTADQKEFSAMFLSLDLLDSESRP